MKEMQYEQIETEHGIFTNNPVTGETAQQVYDRWLESKDKPCVSPQTQEQKLLTEIIISML